MELKFQEYSSNWGSNLICPNCNEICLHQEKIEIFERIEDADKGFHIIVSDDKENFKKININNSMIGNPSPRRQGLKVYFSCETCSHKPILSIIQHKGNTVFNIE